MVQVLKWLLWLFSLMPAGMPYRLSKRLAGPWMRLSSVKRNTTIRNLERCLPQLSPSERQRLTHDSFRHYVCSILEIGHNWYWPLARLYGRCEGIVGEDLLCEALESRRGLVVLAPHFGAWEYLGLYLQQYSDIAILYKPPSNPAIEEALHARRRRGGGKLIPATASGLRQLYAHLRDGHNAGVLPDQQPSRGKGVFAPFFGVPALTGVLVPRLLQQTGSRALYGVCERLPEGQYRVHVLPADQEIYSADMQVALAALNRGVERCIAIDPAQYLWSYRRFKAQPEGAAPFYA